MQAPVDKADVLVLPGVDISFVQMADRLAARGGLVSDQSEAIAAQAVADGKLLLEIADSLTAHLVQDIDTMSVDEVDSVRSPNRDMQFVQGDAPGLTELKDAAGQFHLALDVNPFDTEAIYWLSQVHEIMYQRLGDMGAIEEQIQALTRLTEIHPERHDYAGLLASALEGRDTGEAWVDAGGWWHRASVLLLDDVLLDMSAVLDSQTMFIYLTSASSAFIHADEGDEALVMLDEAEAYTRGERDRAYIVSERQWLLWDTQVQTRKRFEEIAELSVLSPEEVIPKWEVLLPEVTRPLARLEVRYQLAVARYNVGNEEVGVEEMAEIWAELPEGALQDRVREDYGLMAYNLGLKMQKAGNLRDAREYFLQSEATGFAGAARSALMISRLVRNDISASLSAAQRAERGWDGLEPKEQQLLLQHMVELHRRLQNREEAMIYAKRYRDFLSQLN